MLTTHALAIGYRNRVVADSINVQLRAGEMACLIGPNGAGKSTLLRTLAGMQPPLSGCVRLGDADLHQIPPRALARRVAVVLTERVDVGNLSAYALVALGRHPYTDWRGALTDHDEAIVRQMMNRVDAAHLAHRPVNELSDGERQKVMIARGLTQEPELLLLDEPTAFLDWPRRVEILQLLRMLAHTTRRAILLSTHDLDLALRMADRLWLLPAGGPLVAGLPEELALSGALAAAFRRDGLEFDNTSGAFKIHHHPCGPIGLSGEGPAALWTARALERIGYEVVGDRKNAPLRVEVATDHGHPRWRVVAHQQTTDYHSLGALIDSVRGTP